MSAPVSGSGLALDLAASVDPVAFAGSISFDPEEWQSKLLRSTARRVLVTCARQTGKSSTVAVRALQCGIYTPGSLTLIISPGQRQSNEMLVKIRAMYRRLGRPGKPVKDSESELVLENGSRILSLPGTEGTSRGFAGAKLLIIDEAARVDDDVFASVLPMVASDGAIWALSTPWGRRGWFFDLHESPANGWERHKVTVYESAQYTQRRIAEMRSTVGSFTFASDYECIFGDTDTQLFPTEMIRRAISADLLPLEI